MNMYQQGYKNNLAHFGLAEKSRTILCEDLPLSEYEPVVAEEVVRIVVLDDWDGLEEGRCTDLRISMD